MLCEGLAGLRQITIQRILIAPVVLLIVSTIGCEKSPNPHRDSLPLIAERKTDGSKVALYGPESVQRGQTGDFRFCIDADAAGVATLGSGQVRLAFTGAEVLKDASSATIYPPVRLRQASHEITPVLMNIALSVAVIKAPGPEAARIAMETAKIVVEHMPALIDAVSAHYTSEATIAGITAAWNADAVRRSSRLCLDTPVVLNGDAEPGVAFTIAYDVEEPGTGRVINATVSQPWLPLASAQRRRLHQRAVELTVIFPSDINNRVAKSALQLLEGSIGVRQSVVRGARDLRVAAPLRALCAATLLAIVPDSDNAGRSSSTADSSSVPSFMTAAALADLRIGADASSAGVLKELFNLFTEDAVRMDIIRMMAGIGTGSAFTWIAEQIENDELSPQWRTDAIKALTTSPSGARPVNEHLRLITGACGHVITAEVGPAAHELRRECFDRIASLSVTDAENIIRQLRARAGVSDRCMALTLLLSASQPAFTGALRSTLSGIWSLPGTDQERLVQCVSKKAEDFRLLVPHLLSALAKGHVTAGQLNMILASAGREADVPRVYADVARRTDASLVTRRALLGHVLAKTGSVPPDQENNVSAPLLELFDQTLSKCEGTAYRAVLGVPIVNLEAKKLSVIMRTIALANQYGVRSGSEAIKVVAELGGSEKGVVYGSLIRQVSEAEPSGRSRMIEIVERAQLADLTQNLTTALCSQLSHADTPSAKRLSSYRIVARLSSSGHAVGCFVSGLKASRRTEQILTNARFVHDAADPELHAGSNAVLLGWLADPHEASTLATSVFSGLCVTGDKRAALHAIETRITTGPRPEAAELIQRFLDVDQRDPDLDTLFIRYLSAPRRWLCFAFAILLFFARARLGKRIAAELDRTSIYKDCCAKLRRSVSRARGLSGFICLLVAPLRSTPVYNRLAAPEAS